MDAQKAVVERVENSLNALRRELEAQGVEVKITLKATLSLETNGVVIVESLPVDVGDSTKTEAHPPTNRKK